jgi:DNA-binding SARP family transcriptional activator
MVDADTAVALYTGDLAEGLGHDCFAAERERLSDRFEDALAIMAARCLDADDPDGARRAAEHLIVRDPIREEAHEVLIAVHGLTGTRSQVVRQYRRLSEVLARELGEAPLPETDATYRLAVSRTIARSGVRAAERDGSGGRTLVAIR